MEKKVKAHKRHYGYIAIEPGTGYIDLNQQEIKQVVLHKTTEPGSPVYGQVIYDTASGRFKGFNSTGVFVRLDIEDHGDMTGLEDDDHTQYSLVDGTRAFTGPIQGVIRSGGSLGADLVTYAQLEAARQGINGKPAVKVATTENISLNGLQTIDDVSVAVDDRVLVLFQSTPHQNGIYKVQSGAWDRVEDCDTWDKLISAYVFVEEGTAYHDTGWLCTIDEGGGLGTNDVDWIQFTSAGTYTMVNVGADGVEVASPKVGSEFRLNKIHGSGAVVVGGGGVETSIEITGTDKINALNELNVNGIVVQTGESTFAGRAIEASGDGITVTDGNGVEGNPIVSLDHDLQAIAVLVNQGILERTGDGTWQLLTTIPISRGGTGGTTAAEARTNLGVSGKYAGIFPTSQVSAGSYFDVTHSLGNPWVAVKVWEWNGSAPTDEIEFAVECIGNDAIRIHTSVLLNVNTLLVVVVG